LHRASASLALPLARRGGAARGGGWDGAASAAPAGAAGAPPHTPTPAPPASAPHHNTSPLTLEALQGEGSPAARAAPAHRRRSRAAEQPPHGSANATLRARDAEAPHSSGGFFSRARSAGASGAGGDDGEGGGAGAGAGAGARARAAVRELCREGTRVRSAFHRAAVGVLAELIDAIPRGAAGAAALERASRGAHAAVGASDPASARVICPSGARGGGGGPPAAALRYFSCGRGWGEGAPPRRRRGRGGAGGAGDGKRVEAEEGEEGRGGEGGSEDSDGSSSCTGSGDSGSGSSWDEDEEEVEAGAGAVGGKRGGARIPPAPAHFHPTFADAVGASAGAGAAAAERCVWRGFPTLRAAFLLLPLRDAVSLVRRVSKELVALVGAAVGAHEEWLLSQQQQQQQQQQRAAGGEGAAGGAGAEAGAPPPAQQPQPAPPGDGAPPAPVPLAAPPARHRSFLGGFFSALGGGGAARAGAGAGAAPTPAPAPALEPPSPSAFSPLATPTSALPPPLPAAPPGCLPYHAAAPPDLYTLPRPALAALLAAHASAAPPTALAASFSFALGASASSAHSASGLSRSRGAPGGGAASLHGVRRSAAGAECAAFFHAHAAPAARAPRRATLPYRHPLFPPALLARARLLVHVVTEADAGAAGGLRARVRGALARAMARALRHLPPLARALPALHTADNALLEEAGLCLVEVARHAALLHAA
jgi:hypothetical protein